MSYCCTVLHSTALHCMTPHLTAELLLRNTGCLVLYSTVPYRTYSGVWCCMVLYGVVLCCVVLYGVVLCCVALCCIVLYCIVLHCRVLVLFFAVFISCRLPLMPCGTLHQANRKEIFSWFV